MEKVQKTTCGIFFLYTCVKSFSTYFASLDNNGAKRSRQVLSYHHFHCFLQEQRTEVVIEIENENKVNTNGTPCGSESGKQTSDVIHNIKYTVYNQIYSIITILLFYYYFTAESKVRTDIGEKENNDEKCNLIVTVYLEKAGGGAGLGFGLDGGRDSPQGDRPLTIKKLFAGLYLYNYHVCYINT